MKATISLAGRLILILVAAMCIGKVNAQDENRVTLKIGDQVPEFQYSKWLKGEQLTSFTGDRLYVLEFWATWCSPCRAAMPHLTKLQKEYKDKALFIGVDVWERPEDGKSYESTLPAVEKFVKGNAANMGYSVVADNADQHMGNNWLKAAGEMGIPSTYIVRNNKLLWIGHPNSLDSILPAILNGTYDMVAFKARREKSSAAFRSQMDERVAFFKPIQDAIQAKEYDKALTLIDKGEIERPEYKPMLNPLRFSVLLSTDPDKAMDFLKVWEKEHKTAPSLALGEVYKRKGLPKEIYLRTAKNFEEAQLPPNALVLDALATCYANGGDFKSAVLYEEKAIKSAKEALKNNSMVGTINEDVIRDFEKALIEYNKKN